MKTVNWKVYGEALDALLGAVLCGGRRSRSTTATLPGRVLR